MPDISGVSVADNRRPPMDGQQVLDALAAPTCIVDPDGFIVAVNSSWRAFTADNNGAVSSFGLGLNYLRVCDVTPHQEGNHDASAAQKEVLDEVDGRDVADGLRAVLTGRSDEHVREYPCHAPSTERWFIVRIVPVLTHFGPGAMISHTDMTADRRTRDALSHQALHDALTGLPNRLLLSDRLSQALADSQRQRTHVGLAFLDLDHFKRVNDNLGHATGDALLVAVAERLHSQVRDGDTLARYSGDEFVALWRDLDGPATATVLGERLGHAMKKRFDVVGHSIEVRASIGIAVAQPGQSGDDLLLAADAAMYDAKRHGRDQARTFSGELRAGAQSRVATEVGLRAALTREEFVLHYQPVISLQTGEPVAVEALARWQHPERGLLDPDQFIAVAEMSGLILPVGRWALMQACQDAAAFTGPAAGLDIAVNLSTRQLTQPNVLRHVRDALSHSGLEPHRLMLEVTESAVVEDEQAAALALEELDALGVRLAIDDFGTGWSSLLYLRRYPISTLKLDQIFVSGIGRSHDDEAICASVISLAQAVGATSIAEGVETIAQYTALRNYGCQQAQGFLWSPAVPREALATALRACSAVSVDLHSAEHKSPGRRLSDKGTIHMPLERYVGQRIASLHESGASLHTIASALNSEQAANPTGLRWTSVSVARRIAV